MASTSLEDAVLRSFVLATETTAQAAAYKSVVGAVAIVAAGSDGSASPFYPLEPALSPPSAAGRLRVCAPKRRAVALREPAAEPLVDPEAVPLIADLFDAARALSGTFSAAEPTPFDLPGPPSVGQPPTSIPSQPGRPVPERPDQPSNPPVPPLIPGVPEPRTWILMIVSFGLIGWRLRRRPEPCRDASELTAQEAL